MKKRESKSETFHAAPFEYEFLYAPLGIPALTPILSPGMASRSARTATRPFGAGRRVPALYVHKGSTRWRASRGFPPSRRTAPTKRYAGIRHTAAAELSFTNDGRITETVRNAFQQVCGDLGAGVYATAGEAAPRLRTAVRRLSFRFSISRQAWSFRDRACFLHECLWNRKYYPHQIKGRYFHVRYVLFSMSANRGRQRLCAHRRLRQTAQRHIYRIFLSAA